jgi:heterodisulfide reductase subunit C
MSNWGYTIAKDNQINYDSNSKEILAQILAYEPTFAKCIACGSCAGTCTAGDFTHLSLRKINVSILRGETANMKKDIAKCMLCGKCLMVCPRGVNTRNVLFSLRKIIESINI